MAKQILPLLPKHKLYVEPFGGSAAILLQKPRSKKEVYNDLYDEVVNFFRTARDHGGELTQSIILTSYSRSEYHLAATKNDMDGNVERARKFFVRSWLGVGGEGIAHKSGFRRSFRPDIVPEKNFARSIQLIQQLAERFQGVAIESLPAVDVIQAYDSPDTLHYVDPPYLHESRTGNQRYCKEMSIEDHRKLLSVLCSVRGKVLLSGYDSPLYRDALVGWSRTAITVNTTGQVYRKEILWSNTTELTLF